MAGMPRFALQDFLWSAILISAAFYCAAVAAEHRYTGYVTLIILVPPLLGAGLGALYERKLYGMLWGLLGALLFAVLLLLYPALSPALE